MTQANGRFSRFKKARTRLLVMDVVTYTIPSLDEKSWRHSKRRRHKPRRNFKKRQKHISL
jgi:hypothetical protein